MANLFLPAVSENLHLSNMLGKTTPNNIVLKLYVTNTTLAAADTAASYTEMSTMGYAAKTLTAASWTVAQTGAAVAGASYADQVFTFTGGTLVTVYGYFLVDSSSGVLLGSALLDTPIPIQNNGDTITVSPRITLAHV